MVLFSHLGTWVTVPFGSHLEVLVPLGPLVRVATTRPTTRYATMVIPSYEVSAASGALVLLQCMTREPFLWKAQYRITSSQLINQYVFNQL